MHTYGVDPPDRRGWLFVCISVMAFLVAYAISLVLFQSGLSLEWTLLANAAVTMALSLLMALAIDRWLWRWPLLRRLGRIKVMDLNGIWAGSLSSSYDNHSQLHPVTVTIRQHWMSISISLEAVDAISRSMVAAFHILDEDDFHLTYEYVAQPKPGENKAWMNHRGIAVLRLKEDGRLEGRYYYEDNGKFTSGSMFLTFVPRD